MDSMLLAIRWYDPADETMTPEDFELINDHTRERACNTGVNQGAFYSCYSPFKRYFYALSSLSCNSAFMQIIYFIKRGGFVL